MIIVETTALYAIRPAAMEDIAGLDDTIFFTSVSGFDGAGRLTSFASAGLTGRLLERFETRGFEVGEEGVGWLSG